tara:strand:+ start:2411 stop:2875 length:465 start_codon:yes stop_codon:yes gene_type:complete
MNNIYINKLMKNYKLTYYDQILINRIKACILDLLICFFLIIITFIIFKIINFFTLNLFKEGILFIIPVVILSYYSFSIGNENGSTLGMKIFKIGLVNNKNKELSTKELLIYNFLFFIVTPIGLVLLISLIIPLVNDERKCIHDYIFKTKFNLLS